MNDIEDCGVTLVSKTLACSADELFEGDQVQRIQLSLLKWYDGARRRLPWRGDMPPYGIQDQLKAQVKIESAVRSPAIVWEEQRQRVPPYFTWVSEIMCQQTRVETVIEYFLRWIKKFPTIEALANASEEDVNLMWSGLGFYRRARFLHQGAKTVVEKHGGTLPSSVQELKAIPGIGDYTAGAIASIAYAKPAPLVDGNVIRVLSRIKAIAGNAKNKHVVTLCWKLARELVSAGRPGDFNQSLMELGATICKPTNPKCSQCPLSTHCAALAETKAPEIMNGKPLVFDLTENDRERAIARQVATSVTKYPLRATKPPPKEEIWCVYVIVCEGKYLLLKRPNLGLLANQWEFPSLPWLREDQILPPYAGRQALVNKFLDENFGIKTNKNTLRVDLGVQEHVFSHRKHQMHVEKLQLNANEVPHGMSLARMQVDGGKECCWVDVAEMKIDKGDSGRIAMTTGMRKVLLLCQKGRGKSENALTVKPKRSDPGRELFNAYFRPCNNGEKKRARPSYSAASNECGRAMQAPTMPSAKRRKEVKLSSYFSTDLRV